MTEIFKLTELDTQAKKILKTYENERVFLIHGNLGAGKTTLVQAFCKQLGVNQSIQSPSFGLVHEYQSPCGSIFHADLYRLKYPEEIYDIGILEMIDSGQYIFIEWPEILVSNFEVQGLSLYLDYFSETERTLTISSPKD